MTRLRMKIKGNQNKMDQKHDQYRFQSNTEDLFYIHIWTQHTKIPYFNMNNGEFSWFIDKF